MYQMQLPPFSPFQAHSQATPRFINIHLETDQSTLRSIVSLCHLTIASCLIAMSIAPPSTPATSTTPSSGRSSQLENEASPPAASQAEEIARRRSESSSTVRRPVYLDAAADPAALPRSRRNSLSEIGTATVATHVQLALPPRKLPDGPGDHQVGPPSPVSPHGAVEWVEPSTCYDNMY